MRQRFGQVETTGQAAARHFLARARRRFHRPPHQHLLASGREAAAVIGDAQLQVEHVGLRRDTDLAAVGVPERVEYEVGHDAVKVSGLREQLQVVRGQFNAHVAVLFAHHLQGFQQPQKRCLAQFAADGRIRPRVVTQLAHDLADQQVLLFDGARNGRHVLAHRRGGERVAEPGHLYSEHLHRLTDVVHQPVEI